MTHRPHPLGVILAVATLGILAGPATAGGDGFLAPPPMLKFADPPLFLAGHAGLPDPAIPRVRGIITAVGQPDAEGNIFSFEMDTVDRPVVLNELKSWRLTILSGERFASVFHIKANTSTLIEVTSPYGPLNGLADGDLFFAEMIAPPRPPRNPGI